MDWHSGKIATLSPIVDTTIVDTTIVDTTIVDTIGINSFKSSPVATKRVLLKDQIFEGKEASWRDKKIRLLAEIYKSTERNK